MWDFKLRDIFWPRKEPAVTTRTVIVARLSPEMLADLRRRVGGPATCLVGSQTTDIQAGYMLGINHALNVIAQDFTIASS